MMIALDPMRLEGYPEVIEEALVAREPYRARCVAFNRRGTLLAAGTDVGEVLIWDFETRSLALALTNDFTEPLTSVSWSKDGRRLLSSSTGGRLVEWDVEASKHLFVRTLGKHPESSAPLPCCLSRLHPYTPHVALACPMGEGCLLLNLETDKSWPLPYNWNEGEGAKAAKMADSNSWAAACFSKRGDRVFVGGPRGYLAVVDTESRETLQVLRLAGAPRVSSLVISRDGRHLVAAAADKAIRCFHVAPPPHPSAPPPEGPPPPVLTCQGEYVDRVESRPFRSGALTADGEFVLGAVHHRADHLLFVWGRQEGVLLSILEGPKDGLLDLAAHPHLPRAAAVSGAGHVLVWAKKAVENWSAFAPDFHELDANCEYVEKEDEFDLGPPPEAGVAPVAAAAVDASASGPMLALDNGLEYLDLDSTVRPAYLSDSDTEDAGLHHLPLVVPALGVTPAWAAPVATAPAAEAPAADIKLAMVEEEAAGEGGEGAAAADAPAAKPSKRKAGRGAAAGGGRGKGRKQ